MFGPLESKQAKICVKLKFKRKKWKFSAKEALKICLLSWAKEQCRRPPCLSDGKLYALLSWKKDAGVGTLSAPGVVSEAADMDRHS